MEKKEITRKITIINPEGLHARPSALLVEKASSFSSSIFIKKEEDMLVNAKSIMGVLALGASKGTSLTFIAEGTDAEKALDELEHLIIKRTFDE
ncbi:hypothetical protein AB834_02560 [PVC group bacterium (ex Bugula neritina AB1)]|nr:hypothetical protein AB834_02560 [PVC group bacterium (ex Bugula neritina AB1)]